MEVLKQTDARWDEVVSSRSASIMPHYKVRCKRWSFNTESYLIIYNPVDSGAIVYRSLHCLIIHKFDD